MLLPIFQDLIRPQWRAVIEHLKISGGLPVSELAHHLGSSYMAVKQHCEELRAMGYLIRTRVPRTGVGRPEIFYSLGKKADELFSQAGASFVLELLEEMKVLFGESTPEKLLFQHFEKLRERWLPQVSKVPSLMEKVKVLVTLREKEGCWGRSGSEPPYPCGWEELHNPLQRIFERYPRAVTMELRLLEDLLGVRLRRTELSGGRAGQPRIVFQAEGVHE